jgi:hypothetical protein
VLLLLSVSTAADDLTGQVVRMVDVDTVDAGSGSGFRHAIMLAGRTDSM